MILLRRLSTPKEGATLFLVTVGLKACTVASICTPHVTETRCKTAKECTHPMSSSTDEWIEHWYVAINVSLRMTAFISLII